MGGCRGGSVNCVTGSTVYEVHTTILGLSCESATTGLTDPPGLHYCICVHTINEKWFYKRKQILKKKKKNMQHVLF